MPETKEKVAIAMSGGVDSSVAAALLVEQGYDVVGIMLRLWSAPGCEDENRCCSPESMQQARRVAGGLSIPFYVIDARDLFYNEVVQPFLLGLKTGVTPNPCVFCNRWVKWDMMLKSAQAMGAKFLATGHYARIQQDASGNYRLLKAIDPNKDQSYVLSVLTQEQLARTFLPLGGMAKPDVRQIAREKGLEVAEKEDSQDLCFLADGNLESFVNKQAPELAQPGAIINTAGETVGQHKGLAFYTIGQRKGLGLATGDPLYVLRKDARNNTLMIGGADKLGMASFYANDFNWISAFAPESPFEAMVKIRYKAREASAWVIPLANQRVKIQLKKMARDITPGQRVVIYQDDICLGGGTIESDTGVE